MSFVGIWRAVAHRQTYTLPHMRAYAYRQINYKRPNVRQRGLDNDCKQDKRPSEAISR